MEVKSSLPSGMQSPVGAASEQRAGGGDPGECGVPPGPCPVERNRQITEQTNETNETRVERRAVYRRNPIFHEPVCCCVFETSCVTACVTSRGTLSEASSGGSRSAIFFFFSYFFFQCSVWRKKIAAVEKIELLSDPNHLFCVCVAGMRLILCRFGCIYSASVAIT